MDIPPQSPNPDQTSNPYSAPQVKECRGPCGDSSCPHKPKPAEMKWWQQAILMTIVLGGTTVAFLALGYVLEVDYNRKMGLPPPVPIKFPWFN